MKKSQISAWARKNTFRKAISRAIVDPDDMKGIEEWISAHVIPKQNKPIDQEAVDIFRKAQEELCKSFLRHDDTKSIKTLLDMYNKFKEAEVHQLELTMIKNVVKSELDANLLLESGRTFLQTHAKKNFGFESLNQDNINICQSIDTLLAGDAQDIE